ncbi:MAG TPA: formate dehydrogenase accessory sulfurtransferase FdhD [Terracidiphilus sp.]|nr:formate dehydrogenase accessory sulfurtransferase FdhD [Terracidiphilus sp.]
MRPPQHSIELTQVTEWQDGAVRSVTDSIAVEEPLEIRIGDKPITVTMRTPGHDKELAAGFLWSEGLIESPDQLAALHQEKGPGAKSNLVEIGLSGDGFEFGRLQRNFYAASSCGICGKASIESIRVRGLRPPDPDLKVDPEVLCGLPGLLRGEQQVFGRTGGLHAAALFESTGKMIAVREDIGRHNAVDKIVGWALLAGMLPLSHHVCMVSGRGGFEIVQKTLAAGIPVVASVSAPSSLAVKLAREFNQTLIGFLRERRFVVYAGQSRCMPKPRD